MAAESRSTALQRQTVGLRPPQEKKKNDSHDLQTGRLGVVPSLGEHVTGVVANVAGPRLGDEQRAVLQADTAPSGLSDQLAILLPHKAAHRGNRTISITYYSTVSHGLRNGMKHNLRCTVMFSYLSVNNNSLYRSYAFIVNVVQRYGQYCCDGTLISFAVGTEFL